MEEIKKIGIDQFELLAQIISNSFADVALKFNLNPKNAPTHPSNCTKDWIETDVKNNKEYYGYFKDDILIGCVCYEDKKDDNEICYLGRLAILPEFRKNGYGRKLIKYFENMVKTKNRKRIEIGIISEHSELKYYYKKNGFIENNIQKYEHLPFKVLSMYKDL